MVAFQFVQERLFGPRLGRVLRREEVLLHHEVEHAIGGPVHQQVQQEDDLRVLKGLQAAILVPLAQHVQDQLVVLVVEDEPPDLLVLVQDDDHRQLEQLEDDFFGLELGVPYQSQDLLVVPVVDEQQDQPVVAIVALLFEDVLHELELDLADIK